MKHERSKAEIDQPQEPEEKKKNKNLLNTPLQKPKINPET